MNVSLMVMGTAASGLARAVLTHLPAPWRAARVEQHDVDPATLLDRSRFQADALRLLELVPEGTATEFWVGLASFDMTMVPLAYVCGVAPLGGKKGVVSWARLKEGAPVGSSLLVERTLKEVVHELGHAAGLTHCVVPDCVMRASIRPDEMDLKQASYCPYCDQVLKGLIAP